MAVVEIILSAIIGLGVGIGGTILLSKEEQVQIPQHQGTEKAIQQLTELDLTKPICEPKYIAKHGDLLCRELTCLQFSRGLDSQTSGAQCEAISNIANKIQIKKTCSEISDKEEKENCIDLFWKRN
jgi:hypothetical protein